MITVPSNTNIAYIFSPAIRKHFKFIVRNVMTITDGINDTFPVIVLIHIDSGIPVCYPGLERFGTDLLKNAGLKGKTLYKKTNAICIFLNYLLWRTDINSIHKCTINDIRNFLVYLRDDYEGYNDPKEWELQKIRVFDFLCSYYDNNKDVLDFKYSSVDFISEIVLRKDGFGKPYTSAKYNDLGVKKPHIHRKKKNRVLFYEGRDLMIYTAQKYDPLLAFPIALQSASGIREGEIANLTVGGYKEIRGQSQSLKTISLHLTEDSEVFKNWTGKVDPGSIKTHIDAEVYPTFINEIVKLHKYHISLMEAKGYDVSPDQPLFRNNYGKPMTEYTYRGRVKKLFYNHFLPLFISQCEQEGTLADNIAYIEAYEDDYPGAHMFRHWFTNYLTIIEGLDEIDVMNLRRDSSVLSQNDYLHVTPQIKQEYTSCVYDFQRSLVDEILLYH